MIIEDHSLYKEGDSFVFMAVAIERENFVVLKVKETQPNIKGDTSGGGGKPATLETGLVVSVPFHINEGDSIRVDTRVPKYMEKVKT